MLLAIDTENTTWNTGSPFDPRNFNVCISAAWRNDDGSLCSRVFFAREREDFRRLLENATILAGFNLKYDLHWFTKLGLDFSGKRVYCAQLAEFVYGKQTTPYPSLDQCALIRLGEGKLDVVKTEYWDKGLNTNEVPEEILSEYAAKDAELTLRLAEWYMENMPEYTRKLVAIRMVDLLGLQEMEWNGLDFNREEIEARAVACETEIAAIRSKLDLKHGIPCFSWSSPAHISALLFGGVVKEPIKVHDGTFYKSGPRKGEPRYRNEIKEYFLPRLYKPLKNMETARAGVFSVDENHLLQLKGGGELITGILRIKELQKLSSTYLQGLLTKHAETQATEDRIHCQFNQCVAGTSRLSSSKPNLQNIAGSVKDIFRSRYAS